MKKFFVFLLALMFFAPAAFADTDSEIVFHGIPWGISVNELLLTLKEKDIPVSASDVTYDTDMAAWSYQFRNSYLTDVDYAGHKIAYYYFSSKGAVKIAGYTVSQMEFYCHYDIDNGALSKNADDSHYYLAKIWFDVNDEMAVSMYADLSRKLTKLYGIGIENTTHIIDCDYTYTVWNGNNDTAVCLYHSINSSSGNRNVHLMYGKANCVQTLQDVRNAVIEFEIQSVADDTTGL